MANKKKLKFDTKNETDQEKVRDIGNRKKFHTHDLKSFQPLNDRQKQFITAYNTDIPIIFQDGAAGTGKSFLSLYSAFSSVLDPSTEYDRVIIIRSPTDAVKIGFMPGTEEEKIERYEEPYRELIDEMFDFNTVYDNLKATGYLSFRHSGNLRGVTFDNAVIVVDEVQNCDREEILTILTRTGINSRVVICGDTKQNDLHRDRNRNSGYGYLKELINNMPFESTSTINYTVDDVVRSGIVREILIADASID